MIDRSQKLSAQNLNRFFNLSHDAMTITGLDGCFKHVNLAFARIFGQTPKDLLGKPFVDCVHPDDRAAARAEFERIAAGLPSAGFENRFQAGDGSNRWLWWTSELVADEQLVYSVGRDITERKQAEGASREAEDRYRTLFDSIDEGFCVIEVLFDDAGNPFDYRFLEVNRTFETQTGLVNAIGKTMRSLVPEHEQYWFDVYGRIALTGEPERFENSAAGLGRYYDVYGFRLGEPWRRRVAVLFKDVAERHHANVALRQSEERQSFLLKLTDALRPLSGASEIEREATRMLGEALSTNRVFYAAIEADGDTGVIRSDYANGIPSGVGRYSISAFASEFVLEWRAGRTAMTSDVNADPRFTDAERAAYASVSARAAVGVPLVKGGRFVALIGVNHSTPREWIDHETVMISDVAERIWAAVERARAEEALRKGEERLSLALDSAKMGVWELDLQTRASLVRLPQHDQIFGYEEPPEDWSFEIFIEHVHPDDRAWVAQRFEEAFESGEWAFECRIIRADDALRWISARGDFYYDKEEAPARAVGIVHDITERKLAEEERERARREAEDAVRARDEFLSIASHELRNPLAGVKGAAQMLRRSIVNGRADPERLALYTETISHASDRLSMLVDDLLDVSRLHAGQFPLRPQPTDLAALVCEVVGREQASAEGHQLRLDGSSDPVRVTIDRDRIDQVLTNLIDNAVKYSPDGGDVRVTLTSDETAVVVRVQDDGIGLPDGMAEQVFQPFGRAANATARNLPGMGLGLYICRQIAEAHGGRLWAESPGDGQGTTMYLRLPSDQQPLEEKTING